MRLALSVQAGRANARRKWSVRMNAVRREQYRAIAACMSEPQIVASREANAKAIKLWNDNFEQGPENHTLDALRYWMESLHPVATIQRSEPFFAISASDMDWSRKAYGYNPASVFGVWNPKVHVGIDWAKGMQS